MEQEKNEQVVFVKDLLFSALYQWRRMVVAALVFAVLLGAIVGVSEWRNAASQSSEATAQAAMEDYESQKLLLEKEVKDAQKMVESQEEYNLQSAIMKLDPYSVYRATIQLTVLTDEDVQYETADNTSAILHAYAAYLSGDQVIGSVAEAMEMKSKYLTELIVMENGGSTTKSLKITVSYPTEEGAQQILDMLLAVLDQAKSQITQTLGKHNSSVVTSSVDERIDLTIIDRQNDATKRLETLKTAFTDMQDQLDALQAPSFGTGVSVKKVVLVTVLGAILGAGLVACCAWVGHLSGNVVYSARVLKNRTGIKVLGCVPVPGKKNAIDHWLKKLEGRNLSDDSLAVTAATARNYCGNGQSVLIVGDCTVEDQELVAQEMKKLGVQVQVCGSLLRDPVALDKLPVCDGVLLVEKCGYSSYTNVLLAMERIADQDKPLFGCVLLEG